MKKVVLDTPHGPYTMFEVKLTDGSHTTTDLMTLQVAADHGLLHPDEIDEEGYPKLPEA